MCKKNYPFLCVNKLVLAFVRAYKSLSTWKKCLNISFDLYMYTGIFKHILLQSTFHAGILIPGLELFCELIATKYVRRFRHIISLFETIWTLYMMMFPGCGCLCVLHACMYQRVSTIPFHVCVHIIICMYVCGIGCTIESKE